MRYVEVIDLQGNKQIIDCFERRLEERFIIDGPRFGFYTDSIFIINDEKYGLLREFNCKDDSLEEKKNWFFHYLDLDDEWSKLYEFILNNKRLLETFAQEYKGNTGYYAEIKYEEAR